MEKDFSNLRIFVKYLIKVYDDVFPFDVYISKNKLNALSFKAYLMLLNGEIDVDFRYNKYSDGFHITSETIHNEYPCCLGGEFGYVKLDSIGELKDNEKEIIVEKILVPIYNNLLKNEDKQDGDDMVAIGDMMFRKFIISIGCYNDSTIAKYDNKNIFGESVKDLINVKEPSDVLTQEDYSTLLFKFLETENEINNEE